MPVPARHLEFAQKIYNTVDAQAFLHHALYQGVSMPVDSVPEAQWLMPGQALTIVHSDIRNGPVHRPYMIVAVAPQFSDYNARRHLMSNAGSLLLSALRQAGIGQEEVYYTTVTRFPLPRNSSSYRQTWLKEGWEYLLEEFAMVKPKAVLFLGSEPTKLAFGNQAKLEDVRGQIHTFSYGDHSCPALAANSHLRFVSNAAGLGSLVKQLEFFRHVSKGEARSLDGLSYPDRDYKVLSSLEEIYDAVSLEIALGNSRFAIDVETGTDTGHPEDEYVVSFQWSSGPGHARIIPLLVEHPERLVPKLHERGKLRGQPVTTTSAVYDRPPPDGVSCVICPQTGKPVWFEEVPEMVLEFGGAGVSRKRQTDRVQHWEAAVELIKKLLTYRSDTCLMGHNLRYDLSSLRSCFGLDVRQFCNGQRSWDTMLAAHLLAKELSFGLKELTLRITDMGAYDAPMHRWVTENSGEGKLFPGSSEERYFHGFRDIPYRYLLPYGCCDVDATFRLYHHFNELLERPENARIRQIFYEIELPLQHPLMDIERTGMPADEERLISLGDLYRDKYQSLIAELRTKIRWPGFNIGSAQQLSALLYDGPYKGHQKAEAGIPVPKEGEAPPVRLHLTPLLTTGKYPRKWAEVVESGQELFNGVSCKESTLQQLLTRNKDAPAETREVIELLIKIKQMTQFVQLFLCEPSYDTPYPTGKPVYGKGLRGCINSRGRVCTQIDVLSETGRWKHKKPNLANLPKNKEKNIAAILGKGVPAVRSGFKAPDGWVIMEADYCSAELYIVGYLSGDPAFISVLESGHDVHGYNAVKVFNLDCTPNEVAEKYKDKRSAVKTVVFGLIYGLSPAGLADKLTVELKRPVSVDEAKALIEQFFATYPGIKRFIEESKKACLTQGYVETAFGRRRYFPGVTQLGADKQAAAQREATNARIQGTVADMLNVGSINLDRMRYETDIGRLVAWEYLVAIHDAILVLVRKEHVEVMAQILKYCMSVSVPIPGTNDKHLDVDAQCGERWQEFKKIKIDLPDWLEELEEDEEEPVAA